MDAGGNAFSFAAVMLVAAMAPAMLAAMALTFDRQGGGIPALRWWSAGLAAQALQLGALALSSWFDPSCFRAIHEGGQAVIAFLVLGGSLSFLGYRTYLRPILLTVTIVLIGTSSCIIYPVVPLVVILALRLGAIVAIGLAGMLFWHRYRDQYRLASILCAGPLLIFATYLLTDLLRILFGSGMTGLIAAGDWQVILHTGLVLMCMICMIFALQDALHTAKTSAERVADKKSQLLTTVSENIPVGICLFDADLRLVAFNDELAKLLDLPSEQLRSGVTFQELVRYNAERGEYGDGDVEAIVISRTEHLQYHLKFRTERERPGGSVVEVRTRRLSDGSYLMVYNDITETKRIEEALRKSEQRYALALKGANEGIWEWGDEIDGIYVSQRLRQITDTKGSEPTLSSEEWFRRVHVDDLPEMRQLLRDHLRGKTDFYDHEYRMRGDDGRYRWVRSRGLGLRNAQGHVYRMAGSLSDETERRSAQQELLDAKEAAEFANRTKGEFLATMSHELRTPLNAIIGFSELIDQQVFGSIGHESYEEYIRNIHESGTHLLTIIYDILDVSKAEAGMIELYEEEVDLRAVVASGFRLIGPKARDASISLQTEFVSPLSLVEADERRLKQVLINLLSNAVKFTPPGGTILAKAWASPGEGAGFEVVDNGIGIARDEQARMLEPFTQIESSLNRKTDGTGLGLPLCRALVEVHGGSLVLESELGRGTKISVHLPPGRVSSKRVDAA